MVYKAFLIASGFSMETTTATNSPNIVLFMVDDMGWQDTSVPFDTCVSDLNRRYETPNMERLASMGVKMTSAYACSISSPSRCSLMTGMNQARHCVTNWTLHRDISTDNPNPYVEMPNWNYNGIQPSEGINHTAVATSFVQILKEHGYHTIHVGKAHFGATNTPSANPLNYGFEVNIAGHSAGGPASYLGERCYGFNPDGTAWHKGGFAVPGLEKYWQQDVFLTEALTREALKTLEDAHTKQQPFFLYMAHYAVHVPLDKDVRFYDKYRTKGLDDTEARYAALIEGMDKSLGDIMDYLTQTQQIDNTIIIFMSDNGGLDFSGRGAAPEGRHNYPLRSGKGSLYEGGIREPMIVYWKDKVAPNTINSHPLIIEDFFPTILEMAGITNYIVPQVVDGRSFVPLLEGRYTDNHQRALVWNSPHTWIPVQYEDLKQGYGQTCAIRKSNYKLIYNYRTGKKELYNLQEDIREDNDIAPKNPAIVADLSCELGTYLREVGAQRPTFKATSKPCPWPDETE